MKEVILYPKPNLFIRLRRLFFFDEEAKDRLKDPTVIDVKIVKPKNPIFVLKPVALWIQRFSKCWHDTDIAMAFVVCISGVLGAMFCGMGYLMETRNAHIWTGVWIGIKSFVQFGLLSATVVYVLWELRNFGRFMFKWSERYLHESQKSNGNTDRSRRYSDED